jgi:trimeric autotransporter adhesin
MRHQKRFRSSVLVADCGANIEPPRTIAGHGSRMLKRPILPLLLLAGIMSPAFPQEYTISTFAGGAPPPTPAVAVDLAIGEVTGLVPDPFGALYFIARNSVFRLDRDGTVTLVAGTGNRPGTTGDDGAAVAARLNGAATLALDPSGNLYIAEAYEVLRVSPDGSISRFAGTGLPGSPGDGGLAVDASLGQLLNVVADASGNLYIADTYDYRIRKVSTSGIISTFAGGNNQSMAGDGDGGPALSASLYPQAIAIDGSGNIYVADNLHFAVRKITPEGVITTVAGSGTKGTSGDGGPAMLAQFTLIWGVAASAEGDVYISDLANPPRIRKVSAATGIITTVAGSGTTGFSGDGGPAVAASMYAGQIAVDAQGDLLIADDGNSRIRRVTPDGIIHTLAGNGLGEYFSGDGGPAASAQIGPTDVAVDPVGNLYIADHGNQRVERVSNGIINTVAGGVFGFTSTGDGGLAVNAVLANANYVAVDGSGNVYIEDGPEVRKISTNGVITRVAGNDEAPENSGDGGPATQAGFSVIAGLAVDQVGNLYISDSNLGGDCTTPAYMVIRKVSPDGTISTVAQVGGGPLAVDAAGNLYHGSGSVVQKVAPDGTVTDFAGTTGNLAPGSGDGGPATSAGIRSVTALAVDGAGGVYIADGAINVNTIRKVTPDGIITTIAGVNGPRGYAGDGGPAANAQLNTPMGLAVDAAGNVYVADTGNSVVRVLQPLAAGSTIRDLVSGIWRSK